MAGKPGIKSEMVEELMEAGAILGNFAKETGDILNLLDDNESKDHENDKIRRDAMGFLIEASQELNLKNYEKASANLHAAMQKLHGQEIIDLNDDKPRTKAKIKIAVYQEKALNCEKTLTKFTGRLEGKRIK